MRIKRGIFRVVPVIGLAAFGSIQCSSLPGTAPETENTNANLLFVKSGVPLNSDPGISSEQLKNLVQSNTQFASDLYKNLKNTDSNLIFSPYSISQAFAMIYAGAKNQTSVQIAKTLNFTLPDSIIHAGFDSLNLSLNQWATNKYTLKNSNSIWIQERLAIQKNYLDILSAYYNTGVFTVNFKNGYDSSAVAINNWVGEMTEDRISECLPQNSLSTLTRMVLVNTLYFKSMWNDTFSVANTHDSTFFNLDSTTSTVPFMHARKENRYYETDEYQAAELMLAGWRTSMVIIVPKPGYFKDVENGLTVDLLSNISSPALSLVMLNLELPKFSFNSGAYTLDHILSNLGMTDAFTNSKADFSGIDGDKDLYLSNVCHTGFISVNEWGIEAAAATPVPVVSTGIHPEKTLTVDRPFMFFIRDRRSGTVLFLGRVVKL